MDKLSHGDSKSSIKKRNNRNIKMIAKNTKQSELDYILQLQEKREKLNNELMETAIQIADLGKKLYELKEKLEITNKKLKKIQT